MTIYVPGTPQEVIDADQRRQAEANGSTPAQSGTPPAPPPRYDGGDGVMVKTSAASGSGASSSQVRQYTPTGYSASYGGGYGGGLIAPVPPVYPQRQEGNVGKQSGHVCMTYSNVNHEMPHTEYMNMNDQQLHSFHNSGPWMPHFNAWAPAQSHGLGHGRGVEETKGGDGNPCSLCRKSGELHKFDHVGAEWVICFKCAQDAFAALGIRLWLDGKAA